MLSHTNIVPRFECTLMMCGQYPCAFVCVCVRVGAQVVDDNDVGGHGWLTTVQVHIYLHRKVHACSFVWEFKWAHLTETSMNFPPEHTQQFRRSTRLHATPPQRQTHVMQPQSRNLPHRLP